MNTNQVVLPPFFAELVVLAPLAAALVALVAFIYNARLQRLAKAIDVVSDYHKRFQDLIYSVQSNIKTKEDFDIYAKRFWDLQNEQFLLWRYRYLPNGIFKYWLSLRYEEHRKALVNVPGAPQDTAEQAWMDVKSKLRNPAFERLITNLATKGHTAAYRRVWCRRMAGSLFYAIGIFLVVATAVVVVIVAGFYVWPIVRNALPDIPPLTQPGAPVPPLSHPGP